MKFWASFFALLLIAVVLGCGIVQLMHGKYWLMIVGTLAYILAFARFGCLPPKKSH